MPRALRMGREKTFHHLYRNAKYKGFSLLIQTFPGR